MTIQGLGTVKLIHCMLQHISNPTMVAIKADGQEEQVGNTDDDGDRGEGQNMIKSCTHPGSDSPKFYHSILEVFCQLTGAYSFGMA